MRAGIAVVIVALAGCSSLHAHEIASKTELAKVEKIAVLPFENVTSVRDAGPAVTRELAKALAAKKLELIDDKKLEVAHSRVDPPPRSAVDRLVAIRVGQLVGADAVVYGTVTETATPGTDAVNLPALGVSVRVVEVDTGRIIFSGTYSATGQGSLQTADDVGPLAANAAGAVAQKVAP